MTVTDQVQEVQSSSTAGDWRPTRESVLPFQGNMVSLHRFRRASPWAKRSEPFRLLTSWPDVLTRIMHGPGVSRCKGSLTVPHADPRQSRVTACHTVPCHTIARCLAVTDALCVKRASAAASTSGRSTACGIRAARACWRRHRRRSVLFRRPTRRSARACS
jgi:hypothetical protein